MLKKQLQYTTTICNVGREYLRTFFTEWKYYLKTYLKRVFIFILYFSVF